jgi:predicted metal-dependent phosphoesterase TrpH
VELLPRFLAIGLDGLEVAYPGHTPELEAAVEALRLEHGLPIATGGSDCHDDGMRPPGTSGCAYRVVEDIRELLAARA